MTFPGPGRGRVALEPKSARSEFPGHSWRPGPLPGGKGLGIGGREGLVFQAEDLFEWLAESFLFCPAGYFLGHRVYERYQALGIKDYYPVSDAPEDGGKPLLFFSQQKLHPGLVKGSFYGQLQFPLFKGFDQVAEGLGQLGPLEGQVIGEGSDVNHRYAVFFPDNGGHRNPVQVTLENDIHQDQVRLSPVYAADDFFPGLNHAGDLVAEQPDHVLEVSSHQVFILDDQYPRLAHHCL